MKEKSHISLLIDSGYDADNFLKVSSDAIFTIDKHSQFILKFISKEGALNEYQLGKRLQNRDSARRRLVGRENPSDSLVGKGFLRAHKGKRNTRPPRAGTSVK